MHYTIVSKKVTPSKTVNLLPTAKTDKLSILEMEPLSTEINLLHKIYMQ